MAVNISKFLKFIYFLIYGFGYLLSTLFRCVRVFEYQIININQYIQYQLERLYQFDNNALSLKLSALVAFN